LHNEHPGGIEWSAKPPVVCSVLSDTKVTISSISLSR
jgi:hypothetical protein